MKRVEWRYFIVGCVMLAVALFMAMWAFSLEEFKPHHRWILLWILPLASGFAAGSFVGSMTVRSKGFWPGVIVTATGGFGVWLLTYLLLPPLDFPQKSSRLPAETRVVELKNKVLELRGTYETIDDYGDVARNQVKDKAPKLAQQLLNLADNQLRLGHRIAKYEYATYALVLAASTDLNIYQRRQYADQGVECARNALAFVKQAESLASQGDPEGQRIYTWIVQNDSPNRINYLLLASLAISFRAGGNVATAEIKKTRDVIAATYLESYPPQRHPDILWALTHSGK